LDTFTDIEKHHLGQCDQLLVCSQWAKNIVQSNNISIPCEVVPLGVDREIFHENIPKKNWPNTVFLNCGKMELRKCHDLIHECFSLAFDEKDAVELWMFWNTPFNTEKETAYWIEMYKDSKLGHKIRYPGRVQSHKDVAQVVSMSDCVVGISRAEGWNLPVLEGMSCGKSVITTNYSGMTEFCTPQNSMLVDIDELEPAYDQKWFTNGIGNWASFGEKQIEQTVQYMRKIHQQKQSGTLGINKAGIETSKTFSWEHTSKRLVEVL